MTFKITNIMFLLNTNPHFEFGISEAIGTLLIAFALLAAYHFGYKIPKQKKETNQPIIDTTKHNWDKWVDEQFNCN